MKNKLAPFFLFTFAFCLVLSVSAQNLTVPQIMAEPSIAGMRVEGEKLSPDGGKVIFLWNAENKLPRDLYITSTDGRSTPQIILRLSDVPLHGRRQRPCRRFDAVDGKADPTWQDRVFPGTVLSVGESRLCPPRKLDGRIQPYIGFL